MIKSGNILVINLGGIGDLLLSTPALRALKNSFPESKISVMVVPRVYEIVNKFTYIHNIFTFHMGYLNQFRNFMTICELRKRHFDIAINMRTFTSGKSALKMKILMDIIRPGKKAGRDTEGRGYFLDIKIPEKDIGEKYEMDYDIDTVTLLGVKILDREIDFKIGNEERIAISCLLEKEGICEKDILIGIHPGGMPSRRWPLENFPKVLDEIGSRVPCTFVITGGRDELGLADKIVKKTKVRAINLAGRLSIKESGALIERCNIYISNDTGPMHIAAILKVPLIAIFGPGDIIRYDPRNISDNAVVLYKKADCAPCEKVKCKFLKCLKAISPEKLIEEILKLL